MVKNYLGEFARPSAAFRGAPFWAWNCKLEKEDMLRQIDYFREMGMGGFTIHARTGLETEYLGPEFMEVVSACVMRAEALSMKAYLYDEDRWPSGFAGGRVTKDQQYRLRYLVLSPYAPGEPYPDVYPAAFATTPPPQGSRKLLACYQVCLEDGYLAHYQMLPQEAAGQANWYAYLEVTGDNAWFNHQAYQDPLNKQATERFIEETHERYQKLLGQHFGTLIPSIFTDEPETSIKHTLVHADDQGQYPIPYTDDFEQGYQETYGDSFLAHLPEIFWELPEERYSLHRYRYMDYMAERFAVAYSDTLGEWCADNGIALTGHLQAEDTLESQAQMLGEAMRHYRSYQIPGIDILCDSWEFATAKQAQSVVHQMGRSEMMSELYGVTNWDFDFRGHKQQGDWQAALGVTHRVPHLALASLRGESKRDYPASIFYQSPWYRQYRLAEDYFARVNTALMSGKPAVRLAVIHPIESYWLLHGPWEQTHEKRQSMEEHFSQVVHWLLLGMLDFDFLSEAILRDLDTSTDQDALHVGSMCYQAVIVPGCLTLRSTTMELLECFSAAGGKIIFLGEVPSHVDAQPSERPGKLAGTALCLPFDRRLLLKSLEPYRTVTLCDSKGEAPTHYLHQLRKLGKNRILFLAHGCRTANRDIPHFDDLTISLSGHYDAELLDAMTGQRQLLPVRWQEGTTSFQRRLYDQDSLLVYLRASEEVSQAELGEQGVESLEEAAILNQVRGFQTEEPNVLLLDQAEYALDEEAFQPTEEILRLDDALRRRLGFPNRLTAAAQPWAEPKEDNPEVYLLRLRFRIPSEVIVKDARLALEDVPGMRILLNGQNVEASPCGWYMDHGIRTFLLPPLAAAENFLELHLPFSKKTDLESCYLLGSFGVRLCGSLGILTATPQPRFGDLAAQGFPFYGGNLTYFCEVDLPEGGEYMLEVNKFRAPLLQVSVDGGEPQPIAFSPYRANLGILKAGRHHLAITSFGNRFNTLGALHHCDDQLTWVGPDAWRSKGSAFSYEYQLKRNGILAAPRLLRRTRERPQIVF